MSTLTPAEPEKVTGDTCLEWINKKIGFGYHDYISGHSHSQIQSSDINNIEFKIEGISNTAQVNGHVSCNISLDGWNHDDSKRKIGLVLHRYSDGGLKVAILSTERLSLTTTTRISQRVNFFGYQHYVKYGADPTIDNGYKMDPEEPFPSYPTVRTNNLAPSERTGNWFWLRENDDIIDTFTGYATYDDTLNYEPEVRETTTSFGSNWTKNNGQDLGGTSYQLTTSKTTTAVFGDGYSWELPELHVIPNFYCNDPLHLLSGDIYNFVASELSFTYHSLCPGRFLTWQELYDYEMKEGRILFDTNQVSIPYNLILTESEEQAEAYLNTGVLPYDAWLYPLDWENLPSYTEPDDDGDGQDDNDDGDDDRDIEPNLPSAPQFTPSMLSNINWYWITAPQFEEFIDWFWNDVGNIQDFNDLVEKIKGLYNDLASAILMVRYFPVPTPATAYEIGGLGTAGNIVLGMIEKAGSYDILNNASAPIVDIGSIHIDSKYKSFVDMSPYSQIMLYLPFHGFIDLDVNLLTDHDLHVKAIYDHVSGTIQYLLYYDNKMLINSYVAKMAVDIPITLQTKNDRDSAIFSNVSNAVSGLIGAGLSVASGNPMGLLVGANAMNSGVSSAPINVKGTIGETGAFYAPEHCYIMVRRPTISKPETWKTNVGQMCGKSYTLKNLNGKGLTTCYSPRIKFTKTTVLQSEADEIYDYLEKGVIL